MKTSLPPEATAETLARLDAANRALASRYPALEARAARRQPVHTVYGGAHLFKHDTAAKLGRIARQSITDYAPDFATLARVLDFPGAARLPRAPKAAATLAARAARDPEKLRRENFAAWFAATIYERVLRKLEREPVEDLRIDFEDGYGIRPDAEEDGHAEAAAIEVARGAAAGTLPPFLGIRIKSFSPALRGRSIRTLDIFLTTLVGMNGGELPPNFLPQFLPHFVVTLPKITAPEQVAALTALLEKLEAALGLAAGSLLLEVMIETPQALIGPDGACTLPRLVEAAGGPATAGGRCSAAHFGPYDFLGSLGVTAKYQSMGHPACDFARHLMLTAFAGTGVNLSDSCTTTVPAAPHRAAAGGRLTAAQRAENRAVVHRAWKLHYDDARHSLAEGLYQGWDVHPAQLPTRYAAVYAFFLEALDSSAERLRNFLEQAAQATRVGEVFDDAATGQGLLNFFLRAVNCGALSEGEAMKRSGLTAAELGSGSLVEIMKGRSR